MKRSVEEECAHDGDEGDLVADEHRRVHLAELLPLEEVVAAAHAEQPCAVAREDAAPEAEHVT